MMLDICRKFKGWGANSTRSNSFHPNPALHPCDICTHLETDKKNENTNSLACTAYNSTNNGWMAEKMRVIRALADPDRRDLCAQPPRKLPRAASCENKDGIGRLRGTGGQQTAVGIKGQGFPAAPLLFSVQSFSGCLLCGLLDRRRPVARHVSVARSASSLQHLLGETDMLLSEFRNCSGNADIRPYFSRKNKNADIHKARIFSMHLPGRAWKN